MTFDTDIVTAADEWRSNRDRWKPSPTPCATAGERDRRDLNLAHPCIYRAATRRGYVCVRDNAQASATTCRGCKHNSW